MIFGALICLVRRKHAWGRQQKTATGEWLRRCTRCGVAHPVRKRAKPTPDEAAG